METFCFCARDGMLRELVKLKEQLPHLTSQFPFLGCDPMQVSAIFVVNGSPLCC